MGVVKALAGLLQLLSELSTLLADAVALSLVGRAVDRAGHEQVGELVLLRLQRGWLLPETVGVAFALRPRVSVRAVEDVEQLFRDELVNRDGFSGAGEAGEDSGLGHYTSF